MKQKGVYNSYNNDSCSSSTLLPKVQLFEHHKFKLAGQSVSKKR